MGGDFFFQVPGTIQTPGPLSDLLSEFDQGLAQLFDLLLLAEDRQVEVIDLIARQAEPDFQVLQPCLQA